MTSTSLCLLLAFLPTVGTGKVCTDGPAQYLPAVDTLVSAAVAEPRVHVEPSAKPGKGQFLIATRQLADPSFAETVVLLLAYEDNGAMGLIVNRPTEVPLAAAIPGMKEFRDRSDRLYVGGPVARESVLLLIRSKTPPDSSKQIFEDVYVSGGLAALRQALGMKGKTERFRAFAGHAGWGAGQLDAEIGRGAWHVATVDAATVFDTAPSEIWRKLIDRFSGDWARAQLGGSMEARAEPQD